MRSPYSVGSLIAAVALMCGGTAFAAMPLSAVGVLQQYCSDDAVSDHPAVLIVEQPVLTDELATFGSTGFVAQYTRDDGAVIDGTMVVRIKVRRLDGKIERVGKIVAGQIVAGVASEGEVFPVAVRRGETVIWKYRFRDFEAPAMDECVLLIGAFGADSLAQEE